MLNGRAGRADNRKNHFASLETRLTEAQRATLDPESAAQRRVLVAEDNEINFELVRDLLEARGHRVQWARDGIQALDALMADHFDLLLLDLQLPRLSGIDLLRRLRREEATRELRVIVLTADAMVGTREAVLTAGADDYLTKPFGVATFRRAVENSLA
jgi:two-component system, cell cycle response regulator DivK